ncbi:MAG: hypothetical protein LWY06_06275, partial [Firmicutes bacterium]|nr:hypothetical protein [Bacillota bacterium]
MECNFAVTDEKQAIQIAEKYIVLSYNHDVFLSNKLPSHNSAYHTYWLELCHDHPDFSEKYERFEKTPQAAKNPDGSFTVVLGVITEYTVNYTMPTIKTITVNVSPKGLIKP